LATVLLAFDEVGLAVRLQTALESVGHSVSWVAPRNASGETPTLDADLIVLLHQADQPVSQRVATIRDGDAPPAVLLVGDTPDAHRQALGQRIGFVESGADSSDIVGAVERSLSTRYANEISLETALGAMRLAVGDRGPSDRLRVIRGARGIDGALVKQALAWHLHDYAAVSHVLDELREHRALSVPEVEFARSIDGTRTIKTLVEKSSLPPLDAARITWALASVGAVHLSMEPPPDYSGPCRQLFEARLNLSVRAGKLRFPTFYDVLEVSPHSSVPEVDAALRELQIRFSPQALAGMDLGPLAAIVPKVWNEIAQAHAVVRDQNLRLQYNQTLMSRADIPEISWARARDTQAAAHAFAQAQHGLVRGDVLGALSGMALAARTHPENPVYETSLAWARFRAQVNKGADRLQAAQQCRKDALAATVGRRPWAQALVALGLLCVAAGDAGAARHHLRLALVVEPRLPMAQQLLSRLDP